MIGATDQGDLLKTVI